MSSHPLLLFLGGNAMAITANARVLIIRSGPLGRGRKQIGVFGDAVAVGHGDGVLIGIVREGVLGGGPGEVVAADLNVVVGKLAKLVVVQAEQLGFFRGAQVQAGYAVDDERDEE